MTGRGSQYGPPLDDGGWAALRCDECGATWAGTIGETCGWCLDAEQRLRQATHDDLLHPAWLHEHGPRYDALSDIDKRIWDRTRGQTGARDSVPFWAARLKRAVESGLVTRIEADQAIERVDQWLKT